MRLKLLGIIVLMLLLFSSPVLSESPESIGINDKISQKDKTSNSDASEDPEEVPGYAIFLFLLILGIGGVGGANYINNNLEGLLIYSEEREEDSGSSFRSWRIKGRATYFIIMASVTLLWISSAPLVLIDMGGAAKLLHLYIGLIYLPLITIYWTPYFQNKFMASSDRYWNVIMFLISLVPILGTVAIAIEHFIPFGWLDRSLDAFIRGVNNLIRAIKDKKDRIIRELDGRDLDESNYKPEHLTKSAANETSEGDSGSDVKWINKDSFKETKS